MNRSSQRVAFPWLHGRRELGQGTVPEHVRPFCQLHSPETLCQRSRPSPWVLRGVGVGGLEGHRLSFPGDGQSLARHCEPPFRQAPPLGARTLTPVRKALTEGCALEPGFRSRSPDERLRVCLLPVPSILLNYSGCSLDRAHY